MASFTTSFLIGTFRQTAEGYAGRLETLGLDEPLTFVRAAPSDTENAPDWRIHLGDGADGPKVGDGWDHTGEKAGRYISALLDGPILPATIRARLFRSDKREGLHDFVWQRRRPTSEGDD